jgi:hypothetical protein
VLRKNGGFTAVAMLSLAIGIGANSAAFSIIEDASTCGFLTASVVQAPVRLS